MSFEKIKNLLFLHAIIFLYSLTAVCAKVAAGMEFFSFKWILVYGLQILILGVYAILWQQILKKMPLNFAYANKALSLVWGMLFGLVLFDEEITIFNIIGAVIVLCGVLFMVTSNEEKAPETNPLMDSMLSEPEKRESEEEGERK